MFNLLESACDVSHRAMPLPCLCGLPLFTEDWTAGRLSPSPLKSCHHHLGTFSGCGAMWWFCGPFLDQPLHRLLHPRPSYCSSCQEVHSSADCATMNSCCMAAGGLHSSLAGLSLLLSIFLISTVNTSVPLHRRAHLWELWHLPHGTLSSHFPFTPEWIEGTAPLL